MKNTTEHLFDAKFYDILSAKEKQTCRRVPVSDAKDSIGREGKRSDAVSGQQRYERDGEAGDLE